MEAGNANRWERPDAPLGTLVYRAGLLSKEKLEAALEEGARSGRRLGEILLQKGWIDEKDLARLLAGQKSLKFVSLAGLGYDPPTARLLPERLCRYHTAIPIEDRNDRVVVAIADPTDDSAVRELEDELGRPVDLVVATGAEISRALDDVFHAAAAADGDGPAGPTAISPISEVGLRIAAPVSEPEPEPEAESEPEPKHEIEPEPVAVEPEPVAVEPDPVAAEPVVLPVLPTAPFATVEPAVEEPEPAADEPTIERDEQAAVSVAFHPLPAVEPEPEPEAEPEPLLEAPPVIDPLAVAAHEPETEPEASASDPMHADEAPFRIALCLEGGDEIDVAFFNEEAEAEAAARELIAGIAKDGEWPRIGNQFIRPERIVSVDIRARQRWTGSAGRATWGTDAA